MLVGDVRRGGDGPGVVASGQQIGAPVGFGWQAPVERRYRPLALAVLRVEEGRVVEVVRWDRPELFDAFGLPMSLPLSRGSNEDEVNAKEVR